MNKKPKKPFIFILIVYNLTIRFSKMNTTKNIETWIKI